jgi:predicted membrane protein
MSSPGFAQNFLSKVCPPQTASNRPASHSHDVFHDALENLKEPLACLIILKISVGLWLIIAIFIVVMFVFLFVSYVMFAAFILGNIYSAWFFLVIPICMLITYHPNIDKKELMQMTMERVERLSGEAERKDKKAQEMSPEVKERLIKMTLSEDYELDS